MKKFEILALVLLFSLTNTQLISQTRYLDSLFQPVRSLENSVYANAPALAFPFLFENNTNDRDLEADIYEPQGDTIAKRPCIVYAHGGSFLVGSKRDQPVVKFCEAMAARGYVVMSIEYRLGFNLTNTASAERAVYRGIQDMKAAIRYVKEWADSLRIDTNLVFAAGNSAGSVMTLHASFVNETERQTITSTFNTPDLDCLDCVGNSYAHSSVPLAIANFWGAISDTAFMEAADLVPVISFHGTEDASVFPGEEHPFGYSTFPKLQGSDLIFDRMQTLQIDHVYKKLVGADHEPWGLTGENEYLDTLVEGTAQFFYNFLPASSVSVEPELNPFSVQIFPNPAADFLQLEFASLPLEMVSLRLFNSIGQTMLIAEQQGRETIRLDLNGLEPGYYLLAIQSGEAQVVKRILKQ